MMRERMKLALEEAVRQILHERKDTHEGKAPSEPPQERPVINAEALARVMEAALNSEWLGGAGADRLQAILYLEVNDLHQIGRAWLHDGTTPSLYERARLLCDADIVTVITHNGVPLSMGRKVRYPTRAQRRAVGLRDQGCRFPGCGTTRFTEVHHIIHWAEQGGPTDLFNLITLCWHHHHVVHLPGWSMRGDANGDVWFRNPFGNTFGARPPTSRATGPPLEAVNQQLGIQIGEETARPAWGGEQMSSYALDMLLSSVLPREPVPVAA
jgi:hypothetical protein